LVSISRAADGSMRDGLSLLDQAIAFGGGKLTLSDVKTMLGLVDHEHVTSMIRALASDDAEALLAIIEELVAQSRDLETVLLSLAEVFHRVTLLQCVPGYSDPERSDWDAIAGLAQLISAEDAQLFYQIAIKGRDELGLAPDPRTGLEMTLLRMLAFRPVSMDSGSSGSTRPKVAKATVSKIGQPAPARPVAAKPVTASTEKGEQATESAQDGGSKGEQDPVQPTLISSPEDADWMSLQDDLEVSGQVRELARNVHLQSRSDDRWDFVIASSLRHLGSETCVTRLGQAISLKVGHPVVIKLIDGDNSELITAAALDEHRTIQSMSEAEKAINDDPAIKALKEELGAHIVEDSIQPIQ